MSAIGLILDGVLILLLLAALAYGLRLEGRLKALREGQAGFARAVNELNAAAGKAEAALSALRAAGEETDELHGRILAARTLKTELEALVERGQRLRPAPSPVVPAPAAAAPAPAPAAPAAESPARLLQALAANRLAEQSVNRARRMVDDDLFAEPVRKRA